MFTHVPEPGGPGGGGGGDGGGRNTQAGVRGGYGRGGGGGEGGLWHTWPQPRQAANSHVHSLHHGSQLYGGGLGGDGGGGRHRAHREAPAMKMLYKSWPPVPACVIRLTMGTAALGSHSKWKATARPPSPLLYRHARFVSAPRFSVEQRSVSTAPSDAQEPEGSVGGEPPHDWMAMGGPEDGSEASHVTGSFAAEQPTK